MSSRRSGVAGAAVSAIALGLLFIVLAQIVLPALPMLNFSGESKWALFIFGIILFIIGAVMLIVTKLYIKTSADQAFVRTGMGGPVPILDGGDLVIPVVHEIVPVSLQTMRLDVDRSGHDALITGDNLRAD
ncbi:MAG: hypothetical protein KC442_07450, partial [Thermomicrobiales bacterium]|nr:hypothetical protein [Thermomicrobiales bacterium]